VCSSDLSNPEYQKLFLRYVPFERAKTRVQKIRRRKSHLKRKKMSVRNRLPTRSQSRSQSILSRSIEKIDISPIKMNTNTLDDNAHETNTSTVPVPVTYAVNSQALSRLKTKTVSLSKNKPKSGSKIDSKNKTTKMKRS
jgi:hypothetical protein